MLLKKMDQRNIVIFYNELFLIVGTDIGFSTFMRPVLYSAHHDLIVYQHNSIQTEEIVTVVGNVCETGDIIASDRLLPTISEGDIIAI